MTCMRNFVTLAFMVSALAIATPAQAQVNGDEFSGYWKTAEGDGIVQLQKCSMYKFAPPTALCGVIVWDVEVNNPKRTLPLDCNRKIFEATRFENGVWQNGWAFDTRQKKFYNTKLRMKDGQLRVRVFVGTEVNGETMVFTRVNEVPPGCEGKQPDASSVKG